LLKEGEEKIGCHLQIVQPFLLLRCTCPVRFVSPPTAHSSLDLPPPYDEWARDLLVTVMVLDLSLSFPLTSCRIFTSLSLSHPPFQTRHSETFNINRD
jgi:hypothetical protein